MTPAEQDLARELAEHPAWRWAAGMRVCSPDGWARVDDDRLDEWEGWPDLADPATMGCLIAMLGDDDVVWISNSTTVYDKDGSHQEWTVTRGRALGTLRGRTLGEAIARAWLAVQEGGDHG